MSRTRAPKIQNNVVIARAFGDEPLKLQAKAVTDGVVELDLGDATALFVEGDVFAFDERLFQKLRNAFKAGDRSALDALWGEAAQAA